MTRRWQPTLERMARWLKPSAESFAAAAAVYGPDLMLLPAATRNAVEGPPSPECDGRSRADAIDPPIATRNTITPETSRM